MNTTITSQATKQLVALFETAKKALENMDAAVEIIRLTQPNFYNGYKTARKIINIGNDTLSAKIQAMDSKTGEGIANVNVTLTLVDGELKAAALNGKAANGHSISLKTAQGGGANLKNVPDGRYQVMAAKPGYKVLEDGFVDIVGGEMTYHEIKLEKL